MLNLKYPFELKFWRNINFARICIFNIIKSLDIQGPNGLWLLAGGPSFAQAVHKNLGGNSIFLEKSNWARYKKYFWGDEKWGGGAQW